MCKICDNFKSKKIDSKEAFRLIGDALKIADPKKTRHLMTLSDTILDEDIPIVEKDAQADEEWEKNRRED